jgi:nucleotide-binding universal stress UspA family protein
MGLQVSSDRRILPTPAGSSGDESVAVYLVGLNGADRAWRAASYAIGMASRRAATSRLVFVHAVPSSLRFALVPEVVPLAETASRQTVGDVRRQLMRMIGNLPVQWEFVEHTGSESAVLRRLAVELRADAIVVASTSSRVRFFVGSTATRLAKSGITPVIVVP